MFQQQSSGKFASCSSSNESDSSDEAASKAKLLKSPFPNTAQPINTADAVKPLASNVHAQMYTGPKPHPVFFYF